MNRRERLEKAKQNSPHIIAALAEQYGFLDQRKYRDYCIREEFYKLRESEDKQTIEDVEQILGEKFSLGVDSIHKIVYGS